MSIRNYTLKVWRQKSANAEGHFEEIAAPNIPASASFLEMLDIVNEGIETGGKESVHFDSDCREGICGMCSLVINGVPHSPHNGITTCQVRMRQFADGETIWVEPFRAKPFPVLRDLITDRGALDRIIAAGGFVSVRTGAAVDANSLPIPKPDADAAMDSAACIGCGACVAACKNASAMLFVSAKVTHLAHLPQGQPERNRRVLKMVAQMDKEGFGGCTNQYECEAVCPAGIHRGMIAQLNREYMVASAKDALAKEPVLANSAG